MKRAEQFGNGLEVQQEVLIHTGMLGTCRFDSTGPGRARSTPTGNHTALNLHLTYIAGSVVFLFVFVLFSPPFNIELR